MRTAGGDRDHDGDRPPSALPEPDARADELLERRRRRNRESMRRVRMRKRESRQGAQQTVERLQRQLETLVASSQLRAQQVLGAGAPAAAAEPLAVAYAEVLAQTAALGVANQQLRAQVHEFQEAEAAVARMLSDDSERPPRRRVGVSGGGRADADAEAEREPDSEDEDAGGLSLRPLLGWLLVDGQLEALVRLATKQVLQNAELARALVPRANEALGWLDRRGVDAGNVARYHLQKRFTQLEARALPLFLKTWRATTDIEELATVMRWANGMKVLRWLGPDAAVVTRELDIPSASDPRLSDLPSRFRFTLLVFRRRLAGNRGLLIGTSNLNVYGSTADECLAKDASYRLGVSAHTLYGWVFRPVVDPATGNETGVDVTLAGLTTNGHGAYAHNVLMEIVTVALLWENAFVGPILRLTST